MRRATSNPQRSDPALVAETESPHRARHWGRLGRILGLMLAGVGGLAAPLVLISILDRRLPSMAPSLGDVVIGILIIPGLVAACVILHESGHLLGGRIAGFRTMMMGIWPIVLVRTDEDRWRPRVHARLAAGLGIVLSVPTDTHNLRRRLTYWMGGGPAASLFGGALGLGAFFALTPDVAANSSRVLALALVLGAGGAISLLTAVVTLLPMRDVAGDATDGARLVDLLRGGEQAEVHCALSVLVGSSVRGVRPRLWDESLVQTALAAPQASRFGEMARFFAYESALDRGNVNEARRLLHETLAAGDLLPGKSRPDVLMDAAWFAAVHDEDPATARKRLTQVRARDIDSTHEGLIAKAAVWASEGRWEASASCLDAAVEMMKKSRAVLGGTCVARERITELTKMLDVGAPGRGTSSSSAGRG